MEMGAYDDLSERPNTLSDQVEDEYTRDRGLDPEDFQPFTE
jgi:hypothetical protein